MRDPPTVARLDALASAPWAGVADAARDAAFAAYDQNRIQAAAAWMNVANWARTFAEPEQAFIPRWIDAVQKAGVGHAGMARSYTARPGAIGERVAPEVRRWLLGNAAFSDEFFSTVTAVDSMPEVLSILDSLYRADPLRFREYTSLALALAVVYDVPPRPDWPHGQVSSALLPRRWPAPAEAFDWWVREDLAGRTWQRLARLHADELKFVIDAAAPAAEREWAQRGVAVPFSDFSRTYFLIQYRMERAQQFQYVWPGPGYRLSDILATGGICVDQAYFATEVGKARGVPTLLFRGEGRDGRHAWFGYLDQRQQWQLDAGRYAEQRYITGVVMDPQTWRDMTDHEVKFLSERFRELPTYGQSRVHAAIAAERLRLGQFAAAAAGARVAVGYHPKNLEAWELLLAAQQAQALRPATVEATLREAARSFQQYPDLEIRFMNRVIASLRGRGETSLAEVEERYLAQKYQTARGDLSIQQAAQALQRSFQTQGLADQIRTYNAALDQFGRGAGIDFFDRIVVVFAEHLLQLRQRTEAVRAVERARQYLAIEQGKQLDSEITRLLQRVRQ